MRFFAPVAAALYLGKLSLRVAAHGFPSSVIISGKTYPGANGPSASSSSPFRKACAVRAFMS